MASQFERALSRLDRIPESAHVGADSARRKPDFDLRTKRCCLRDRLLDARFKVMRPCKPRRRKPPHATLAAMQPIGLRKVRRRSLVLVEMPPWKIDTFGRHDAAVEHESRPAVLVELYFYRLVVRPSCPLDIPEGKRRLHFTASSFLMERTLRETSLQEERDKALAQRSKKKLPSIRHRSFDLTPKQRDPSGSPSPRYPGPCREYYPCGQPNHNPSARQHRHCLVHVERRAGPS